MSRENSEQAVAMGGSQERQSSGAAGRVASTLREHAFWLLPLVVMTVLGLTSESIELDLLVQAYIFAVLALTVDIQWGYTGILTFGTSAVFGIGAYSVGVVFVHWTSGTWALPLAILVGVMAAAAAAYAMGWLTFYTRTQTSIFYIAIVTLAASVLLENIVTQGGQFTGASNGLTFIPLTVPLQVWYWLSSAFLLACIAMSWRLVHGDAGLVMRGVRDDEQRLRYLGFDVSRIKTVVFVICGALGGLAGILYASYATVVAPSLVGFSLATSVLMWTAIGGRGTIFGPVIAAVLINFYSPSLNIAFPLIWQLLLGILFVLVVVFAADGVGPRLVALTRPGISWLVRHSFLSRMRVPSRTLPDTRVRELPAPPRLARSVSEGGDAGPEAADSPVVLKVEAVNQRFGAMQALTDVSFQARAGELVGIVGPNGAGKSTLLKCLADGTKRFSGDVLVHGQSIGLSLPNEVATLGLGFKFQTAQVFENVTVGDSVRLASWRGRAPSLFGRTNEVAISPACERVLDLTGLAKVWDVAARELNHGEKQALELAMVLASGADVLLLDEPTAGLTEEQRRVIGAVLRDLVAGGACILLVEHDFQFIKNVVSRLVVMHEGKIVVDGSVAEASQSEVVQRIYLGRKA